MAQYLIQTQKTKRIVKMRYEYIESPNKSSRKGKEIGGIIAHFTVSGSLNDTVRYMCNKIKAPSKYQGRNSGGFVTYGGTTYYNARASANYVTGRQGRSVRLVPENMAAWHAGSKTTKPKLNGKGKLNLWTIGHELCNWGPLRKVGNKFYTSLGNWTHPYNGPKPTRILRKLNSTLAKSYTLKSGSLAFPDGIIEYWEPYTEEQLKATIELWKELIERYGIKRDFITGHEDVDPTRKCDPGPAFPWDDILAEVCPRMGQSSDLIVPNEDAQEDEDLSEVKMAETASYDDRSKYGQNICLSLLHTIVK